jgi:hypothetical protein
MPGPGDRYAQIGRSVLPVQIGGIPGTQNWDVGVVVAHVWKLRRTLQVRRWQRCAMCCSIAHPVSIMLTRHVCEFRTP